MSAVRPLRNVASSATVRANRALPEIETFASRSPLVVFDLDGTLVDTAPDLAASLNHCCDTADLPVSTLNAVRVDAGRGAQAMLRAAYARAGRELSAVELADQTERFLGYYRANIAVHSQLYPGALEALDRLARSGARLAVCTNKTEALAVRLLDALQLSDRFAAICGADTFSGRKPDPVHLLGTIARAGSDLRSTVMIGDSATDMDAARRVGIPAVLVTFGYDTGPSVRQIADAAIERYDDLDVDLLSRLFDDRHEFRAI
ncbi:HAD-IA family hydrolase [Aureimonas sp. AU12]|uniref:HAD-IA family hydrolase n=1 Tax=Aureimonas sp. AU12 TaxID=1638161 RepID=UPI0007828046|nr:HAD-IA family hydrolase [Aureimonas sp. AU12]